MESIQSQQSEIDELKARKETLEEGLAASKVVKYIPLITSKGKLRGELDHITVKQYERFVGRKPPPGLAIKGKIRWEAGLDVIASGVGYRDHEVFRNAVLAAKLKQDELDEVKHAIKQAYRGVEEAKHAKVAIIHTKLDGSPPVYPKEGKSTEIVTEVDGMTITRRRNPSFWQVESDKDSDGKPETTIRIRYAEQAEN